MTCNSISQILSIRPRVDITGNKFQFLSLMYSKTPEFDNRLKRQRLCENDCDSELEPTNRNGIHSESPSPHPTDGRKVTDSVLLNSSTTSMEDEDKDNFVDSELSAKVLEFQKKAIWCRMFHYKRLYYREHEIVEGIKSKEDAYSTVSSLFVVYLEKIKALLETIYRSHSSFSDTSSFLGSDDSPNILQTIELLHALDMPIQNIDSVILERFATLEKLTRTIVFTIKNSSQISLNSKSLDKVEQQNYGISEFDQTDEMNMLRISVKRFRSKIASLQEELDKTKYLLERTERKLDKAYTSVTPKEGGGEKTQKEIQLDGKSIGVISALEAEKSLSESRLIEIEKLRSDNSMLLSELNNERSKLSLLARDCADNEKERGNLSKLVSSEMKLIAKENSILKSKLEEAEKHIETLKLERRSYLERLQSEEAEKRSTLESQIKRLNQDLQRVRSNRNYLQHSLNLRISDNENEISRSQRISTISKAREERITSLLEEIRCLKLIIVSSSGDRNLYELFEMYHGDDLANLLESQIPAYKKKIDSLSAELALLEKRLSQENAPITENEEIERLNIALKESEASLFELREKYKLSEKTQARLLREIETLGEAWSELEKQARSKLIDSTSPEETVLRYAAEKSKLEQKNLVLIKQLSVQASHIKALKTKSDKQSEQITLVGQRENILISQLKNIENELSLTNALTQKYQHEVGNLMSQVAELKSSEKKWISRHSSLLSYSREKLAHYEENEYRCRKLLEEREHLREQLNSLKNAVSSEGSGNMSLLKKELEEYKFLLKCSSCNTRFKSNVLMKCMHTFCKECIEETWNSRQRKCPSCGTNFSKQEVKQIYL